MSSKRWVTRTLSRITPSLQGSLIARVSPHESTSTSQRSLTTTTSSASYHAGGSMVESSRRVPLPGSVTDPIAGLAPPNGALEAIQASRALPVQPSRTVLPKARIEAGSIHLLRLQEHYHNTLSADLLYMTYQHVSQAANNLPSITPWQLALRRESEERSRIRRWDQTSPYAMQRPARPPRGNRRLQPQGQEPGLLEPARDLVRLERVIITSFCRDAILTKHSLVTLIAQLRAITGASVLGSSADPALAAVDASSAEPPSSTSSAHRGFVRVVRAKTGAASFKIRPGMPVGAQAVLPASAGLDFIDILVTFVLPRLRSFSGFSLPSASLSDESAAALSGVVSLGMGPEAMAMFPQTDINWDAYPGKALGFQIDCVTNQRGPRATDRARKLLSGLGVPFVRRGG